MIFKFKASLINKHKNFSVTSFYGGLVEVMRTDALNNL